MNKKFGFTIEKRDERAPQARVGVIHTPHGDILTPAFIPVGTKATVKAMPIEMVNNLNPEAVLANTYHLYLNPGEKIVEAHGGFAKMMNWQGPTFTDSGGFQVFSLGAAFDTGVSKISTSQKISEEKYKVTKDMPAHAGVKSKNVKITEDGVYFKDIKSGAEHFFSPEKSMQIQHALGADIFFAFDECTSPLASREYQIAAMDRTHRWAKRCIDEHRRLGLSSATGEQQALFAVVQGGANIDLRAESAKALAAMGFDGFGIGGSFTKEDMALTVKSSTDNLPEDKPRHLLGIGEPIDLFLGVEYGIDTFDCVTPTRIARHGNIYTYDGKISLNNTKYQTDMNPVCEDADCYAHSYTKSYLAHLFRSDEMLASTIASAHNLHFLVSLTAKIRQSILDGNFFEFKKEFCERFY